MENEMANGIDFKLLLTTIILIFLLVPIAVTAAPFTVSGHYYALAIGGCHESRSEVLSGDFTGTGDYTIADNIISGTGSGIAVSDAADTFLPDSGFFWNGGGTGTISGNSVTGSCQGIFSLGEDFHISGPGQGTLNGNILEGKFDISGVDSLDGCPFSYSGYVDANSITLLPDTGLPFAAFVAAPSKGPAPLQVSFIDLSRGTGITSRVWEYKLNSDTTWTTFTPTPVPPNTFIPDGVSLFTFPNAGTYNIKLTVTGNGGSDDETKANYISVSGPPIAAFEASPTSGSVPLKVIFTDLSTGDGITSRVWEYKLNSDPSWTTLSLDGSSSYTFPNAGTYDIKLTVTGTEGSDDETKTNYISVTPRADFSASPTEGPVPLKVIFTDLSTGDGITSREWQYKLNSDPSWTNFNLDGSSSFTFTNCGNYDVKLSVTGIRGSDDETKANYISVSGPPIAAFEASPTSGSVPLKVKFTDLSTGDGITSRVWEYKLNSDPSWTTLSLDGSSSYTFPNAGIYDIKLTVTGTEGSDDEIKTNYISVTPRADFSASPTEGPVPLKVIFTDLSTGDGITSRVWEYKLNSDPSWTTLSLDGSSSYTFPNAGTYDIKLTVTGTEGSDDEIKTNYINAFPPLMADFEIYPADDPTTTDYKPAGNTIPMVGGSINFDARKSTGDIMKYVWDFGDGTPLVVIDKPTFQHVYDQEKTFKITLEIVDKNGNTVKKKGDFTIPKLQPGDIIFCSTKGYEFIPGFYSHTGIYIGNGKIIETVYGSGHGLPANGVGISDIKTWAYPNETAVAVYRPQISDKYIKNAVKEAKGFANQKTRIPYDLLVYQKSQAPTALYCSELVWAAYSLGSGGEIHRLFPNLNDYEDVKYGEINLGNTAWGLGITPSKMAEDSRLLYVAGHWEDEPGSPN